MKLLPRPALILAAAALAVVATRATTQAILQPESWVATDPQTDAAQAQRDMAAARREGAAARLRAEKLEKRAGEVTQAADRTARDAAAIAARIQEADAEIATRAAQVRLIASLRGQLRAQLAQRQEPLARLTASLQRLSRRPPLLALLRPGSVRDAVYMRAMLNTMLPEVERRTAALRAAIARAQVLEEQARAASAGLAQAQARLRERRQQLAALESRQRLEGREVAGIAARENDRALVLAEQARDLGDLVKEMGQQGTLREQLAALPGPILRPSRPQDARVANASPFAAAPEGLTIYMLPVTGRLVTGFGEDRPGQARSIGVTLAPRERAQAVAPAPGRIAFAGPYQGFGRIIIIEHAGGWTSLVTGLARLDVRVGDAVVAGSPIGVVGPGSPRVMVELRRDGTPVNPLQYLRSL